MCVGVCGVRVSLKDDVEGCVSKCKCFVAGVYKWGGLLGVQC